ncbi:hypothetical protein VHEMI05365 [[Torrubiella] hemipterigena]|uniref:Zn(2)-C6 fungal-type domain-containing protein n=1 Tax=[Torrubiella] hemipterigena TaxID=1531966 RepID=A0A0A1T3X0_9HYPO|nr:hypothetical protein VHEMI05365 [[Torrubiella] hemipterigena]
MSRSTTTTSTLPQGFSVFQPSLGAQLQFFPAMGSQELDDLVNAYVPGAASVQEKRASIALDFFEHTQITGQSFKFYPVFAAPSATPSPSTSAASSFNVSPVNQTWDWSQPSRAGSVSSHTSTNRVSKASASRQRATDFNVLPGMKIMTKDGRDVTNSASRGSKTKEQRDHAHLMRIIKACDSCRKKKIRCDPSHKKRGGSQVATTAAPAKVSKAMSSPPRPQPSPPQSISPPVSLEEFTLDATTFDLDTNFDFDLSALEPSADLWDQFVQFPAADDYGDYNLFTDLDGSLSSQSSVPSSSSRSSSSSGSGSVSPSLPNAPHGPIAAPITLSQLDTEVYNDYTDFNLYSPGSTFSEDERMLDIGSSSSGQSSVSQSPREDMNYGTDVGGTAGVLRASLETVADGVGLGQNHDRPAAFNAATESNIASAANYHSSAAFDGLSFTTNSSGQLIICCPPGTVAVANGATAHGLNNNVASSAVAASSVHTADMIPDLNDLLASPTIIDVGAGGSGLEGPLSDATSVKASRRTVSRRGEGDTPQATVLSSRDAGTVYYATASYTAEPQLVQSSADGVNAAVSVLAATGTAAVTPSQALARDTGVGRPDRDSNAQYGLQQVSPVSDVIATGDRGGVGRTDLDDRHLDVAAAMAAERDGVGRIDYVDRQPTVVSAAAGESSAGASNDYTLAKPTQPALGQQDIASAMSFIASQTIVAVMLCHTVASLQAGVSSSVRPVLPASGLHGCQEQETQSNDLVLARPIAVV